jgi:hypothetical protein
MSNELTVYLARETMPEPAVWARSILERGFDAEMDSDFDVEEFVGFLACRFDGEATGFEYSSGPIEYVDDLELPEEFDFSVTFTVHGDERELASATVCAAILCALGEGVLVDPQADSVVAAEDAVGWACDQLKDLDL